MPAAPTHGAALAAVHRATRGTPTVLSFDALRARAHRVATRALPARATLPCGCNDDTLCPVALELWRAYFRTGHTLRAAPTERRVVTGAAHDHARRAYERHRKGGRPDGRGALRPQCGACHGHDTACPACGVEATREDRA